MSAYEPANDIQHILESLVQAVVKKPEEVRVKLSVHGPLLAFAIKVAEEDIRRVIGARGKHFKALELITKQLGQQIGRECHLAIEEDRMGEFPVQKERVFPLNEVRDFAPVKTLLARVASMFAKEASDVVVIESSLGSTTHIFEIKANPVSYTMIYGPNAIFDYGEDGAVIGSIKNIFDGIGKNHGKMVRIVLTKS